MNRQFNRGLFLTSLGSFWWGFVGVIYFKYIAFIGHIEVVIHRCLWTAVALIITTFYFSKWKVFFLILSNKKILIGLFFSGLLIFINWAVWIYAVATNKIIDASFGYFIMPILSVFLGFIFFDEKLNNKRILTHKLTIIQNDIKIMKDTIFDLKMKMNEMKKLILDIIQFNHAQNIKSNNNDKKNYWFYK